VVDADDAQSGTAKGRPVLAGAACCVQYFGAVSDHRGEPFDEPCMHRIDVSTMFVVGRGEQGVHTRDIDLPASIEKTLCVPLDRSVTDATCKAGSQSRAGRRQTQDPETRPSYRSDPLSAGCRPRWMGPPGFGGSRRTHVLSSLGSLQVVFVDLFGVVPGWNVLLRRDGVEPEAVADRVGGDFLAGAFSPVSRSG
jgi:hypothetical protein